MTSWLRGMLTLRQKHIIKYARALYTFSHLRSFFAPNPFIGKLETSPKFFFKRLLPVAIVEPLVRIGGNCDGGYLTPVIGIEFDGLISPGVGDSVSFEMEFVGEKQRAVLIDATVTEPVDLPANLIFISKMLGARSSLDGTFVSLQDIRHEFFRTSKSLALQMDIEGAEYEVLGKMRRRDLNGMNLLLIEFHNFHNMLQFPMAANPVMESLALLEEDFFLIHTHPNNAGGFFLNRFRVFPKVVETTWIRKSLVKKVSAIPKLPHTLDIPNDPLIWDLTFPRNI